MKHLQKILLFLLATIGLVTACDRVESHASLPVATADVHPTVAILPTMTTSEAVSGGETAVSPPTPPLSLTEPVVSDEPLTLAWTFDTGAAIHHPPLPVGDMVVAVPVQGPVFALDVRSGEVRWQYDPPTRIWERAYASDGRSFFIGTDGGKLVALDFQTGNPRWEKELGINAQTPLLVAGGVLYVPTTFVGPGLQADPEGKARLYALNAENGQELWLFESDNYILQTPFRQGDTVYVSGSYEADIEVDEGGPMRLYALAAGDGSVQWTYESEDGFPKQLYANDTAVAYIAYQDFASGVDAATGELRWRKDTGNWVPSLSGAGDTIYFGSANTVVHALDVANGRRKWQFNIPEGTFNYVLNAPVQVGDTLYFLTQQGDIMALDAEDGILCWHMSTGIEARTGLSVADDWLFVGDAKGTVFAYTIIP